jgi:hypothetical protein
MTPLMKNQKITQVLPMMVINRGGGGKNPLSSMTLGQFTRKKSNLKKNLINIFLQKTTMAIGWVLT